MAKDNIFKERPVRALLLITTLLTILLLIVFEVGLRFTAYRGFVRNDLGFPAMFIADKDAGFDLMDNFKHGIHTSFDIDYQVHTNNIACYDRDIKLERNYNLIIGDSFTWGFTPLKNKWTTVLENITAQKFVKCGVPAYGTKQALNKLKKTIKKLGKTPKTIILGYYWNDLNDDYAGLNAATVIDGIYINRIKSFDYNNGRIEYLSDAEIKERYEQYKKYGNPDYLTLSSGQKVKLWIKEHSIIANLLHNYISSIRSVNRNEEQQIVFGSNAKYASYLSTMNVQQYPWLKSAWEQHLQNIDEMIDYAESIKSKFMIVIIPNKSHVYANKANKTKIKNIDQSSIRLKNHLSEKGVLYLDLYDGFISHSKTSSGSTLYLPHDLHLSLEGEALAGTLISGFISTKGFLLPAD